MDSRINNLAKEYDKCYAALMVARKNLEQAIQTSIKSGTFKSDSTNLTIWKMLQNLRKRGIIENMGTRKIPEWVFVKANK
jgi:hypothetical protein